MEKTLRLGKTESKRKRRQQRMRRMRWVYWDIIQRAMLLILMKNVQVCYHPLLLDEETSPAR